MRNGSLKCFGVGDGWPSANRGHSSYLYQIGKASVLIDCGEPISRSYKASGFSYDLVDHLFLSHLHFDHAGGFFMLMQSFWLEGRTKPLVVHAPADGIPALRGMLQAGCIYDELLPFRLQYRPLEPGRAMEVQGFRTTPFPTTHLQQMRKAFGDKYPQSFLACSFLIESGNVRVGHSADIGAIEDLIPLVEQPLRLLVCELAHVPAPELFRFLRGRKVEQIAFVHLSRDCHGRFEEIQVQAREILGSTQVAFPKDGDEIVL